MYKVVGKENDMFKVLDLDEGTEELLSADQLVLGLGVAEIEGCQHSENGIEVWYDGVEKYEIPIEVWAPVGLFNVRNVDGTWRYEVSNLSGIRRAQHYSSKGKLVPARDMSKLTHRNGYQTVVFSNCGQKRESVHRVVADVFCFNAKNAETVNHKDQNPLNNKAYNLEWMTMHENCMYGDRNKKLSEIASKPIRQYSKDGVLIREWKSATEVASELGYTFSNILSCCNRKGNRRYSYGYIWRFVFDDELFEYDGLVPKDILYPDGSVRQYTLTGEFVNEYASYADAGRAVGVLSDLISMVCRRKRGHRAAGGFIWRHSSDDELEDGLYMDDALLDVRIKHQIRKYSLKGEFVAEFNSVADASRACGIRNSNISVCCRRRYNQTHGFIWRYSDDDEFADRPENAKAIEEFRKSKAIQSE